ncbi:2-oxoacid:acceptor oxidoreductase family protein [Hippea maritima]|uniref:Pyruvate/ketoisovalerate oxidoreductase, gamma subunit n=1 Tax=Hippea maritima (strain ATCC 700847 / DSM 10411 / MH2) TaxID=760142 RepID=F2LVI2_HIPMA|nr:2-oxoacid:acceptor oxidoreductase family protein [Hippea maritima]AEA33766.1 pyruvate/ketoisovalerate oxidoreductase, gamma subunit [Hippea maritima DSM 10411]
MKEIGLHGRGGQGVVMAGELLANIYFFEGYNVQFMPSYGAERRGSPSNAYVRIDKERKILTRYSITMPDAVVVFNLTLLTNITLKNGGLALINSAEDIKKTQNNTKIFVVDANSIALENGLGTPAMPLVNTALLGAYCKASGEFSFDTLKRVYEDKMGKRARFNIEAAEKAYESVREI